MHWIFGATSRRLGRAAVMVLLAGAMESCIIVRRPRVVAIREPVTVTSPVKAHLLDGSTVVFPQGVVVSSGTVRGLGTRFDLTLNDSTAGYAIPFDSVAAMEAFQNQVDGASTVAVSLLTTSLVTVGAAALAVAIFGSCPTYYSFADGTPVLEAEGFSYSIAPLFEVRDVDRISAAADRNGEVPLEVRNEALETHYINHMEVLAVHHGSAEHAYPDGLGRVVVVEGERPFANVRDRTGREVTALLRETEPQAYASSKEVVMATSVDDFYDHLELDAPQPVGVDSVALVFRLRNSLLSTVLFYDIMLAGQGLRALDWVGRDLQEIGPALDLARWYTDNLGMRIEVLENGEYRQVGWLRDSDPIAWKDVAVVIPVPDGDALRVRLSFVADSWRIDRLRYATFVREGEPIRVPVSGLRGATGEEDLAAIESIRSADEAYLQTSPGDRMTVAFDVGPGPSATDSARTLFVASQGYYIEWMRRSWLESPVETTAFTPSDTTIMRALGRWRSMAKDSLEALFYATRLPVR